MTNTNHYRNNTLPFPSSLCSLCLKSITSNVLVLQHLEWKHCRLLMAHHVLDAISASQLLLLEDCNPILLQYTNSIWKRLLKETYPSVNTTETTTINENSVTYYRDLFLIQREADQQRANVLALKLRQKYQQLSSSKPTIRPTNRLIPLKPLKTIKGITSKATQGVKILEKEKKSLKRDRPSFTDFSSSTALTKKPTPSSSSLSRPTNPLTTSSTSNTSTSASTPSLTNLLPQLLGHLP